MALALLDTEEWEGPTPRGVGGLKYFGIPRGADGTTSHPSRGGWIEIPLIRIDTRHRVGPTPRGVGGLKFDFHATPAAPCRPTPRGVGGLKYGRTKREVLEKIVPPLAGWVD